MARCSPTLICAAVLLCLAAALPTAFAQGGWNTGRGTFCEYFAAVCAN